MEIRLPEIVCIGIYNSQVIAKNKIISQNRKTSMFEIEIPMEKGGISYIDDEQTRIEADMVICAKPGQVRHTRFPFKCYYIHMILKEGALYNALMDIPAYIKTDKYKQYLEMFKKMCKYYDTALENDEIILHGIILELIHTLINDSKKQLFKGGAKNCNYSVIEKSMKYIRENLMADLSLDMVAGYAGFSPIHFHRCFKEVTRQTLHEYVEEQRIKKAANMLITTGNTLSKIAYECGFSSQSYFSYAFKRRMNMTPREYTKKMFERYDAEK